MVLLTPPAAPFGGSQIALGDRQITVVEKSTVVDSIEEFGSHRCVAEYNMM